MEGKDPLHRARRRDRLRGLFILVFAFAVSLGISLWAKHASEPEQSRTPAPPSTGGVVGFPRGVDPIKTLPRAQELTRRSILRGFVAEGVKANGTLDVLSGNARVRYAFQSSPGHGPQPPRVPGVVPRRLFCGRQTVHVQRQGIYAEPDQTEALCPPTHSDTLPRPRCTLQEIWQHAIERGVSKERLARIEYYRSVAGPAWRFELPDGSQRFSVYGDCQRELSPAESVGSVP
jgi:hypothetical protein